MAASESVGRGSQEDPTRRQVLTAATAAAGGMLLAGGALAPKPANALTARSGAVGAAADPKQRQDLKILQRTIGHPNFADALVDISDIPAAGDEAKRNPKDYLRRKGVPVPNEATVTLATPTDEYGATAYCFNICFWGWCW